MLGSLVGTLLNQECQGKWKRLRPRKNSLPFSEPFAGRTSVTRMSEEDTVKRTRGMPATVDSLVSDLSSLGVRPGMILLVHSSLSSLGWVVGGPVAVILALEQILGPKGTLVMPTFTGLSDPARWKEPPVPKTWWRKIRESMPPFDPELTPTRDMGVVPECFRNQKGVVRSSHPQVSFAARGPRAQAVIKNHPLNYPFGEGSPLSRIYDRNGYVLLLGTDHSNDTSLHLAEHRAKAPRKRPIKDSAPIMIKGRRRWVQYQDIQLDHSDFNLIGAAFERETGHVAKGPVGCADAMLMPQRALVDFAKDWIERNRGLAGSVHSARRVQEDDRSKT
jgi:aminoglycoside 3-N-acetyltransferase